MLPSEPNNPPAEVMFRRSCKFNIFDGYLLLS